MPDFISAMWDVVVVRDFFFTAAWSKHRAAALQSFHFFLSAQFLSSLLPATLLLLNRLGRIDPEQCLCGREIIIMMGNFDIIYI